MPLYSKLIDKVQSPLFAGVQFLSSCTIAHNKGEIDRQEADFPFARM